MCSLLHKIGHLIGVKKTGAAKPSPTSPNDERLQDLITRLESDDMEVKKKAIEEAKALVKPKETPPIKGKRTKEQEAEDRRRANEIVKRQYGLKKGKK